MSCLSKCQWNHSECVCDSAALPTSSSRHDRTQTCRSSFVFALRFHSLGFWRHQTRRAPCQRRRQLNRTWHKKEELKTDRQTLRLFVLYGISSLIQQRQITWSALGVFPDQNSWFKEQKKRMFYFNTTGQICTTSDYKFPINTTSWRCETLDVQSECNCGVSLKWKQNWRLWHCNSDHRAVLFPVWRKREQGQNRRRFPFPPWDHAIITIQSPAISVLVRTKILHHLSHTFAPSKGTGLSTAGF